ncbi:MAG: aspartate carbamoyltransferase catalytic subunit [Xanthomonadales bacterium]|nr:aspartate carbamoyltransferase catalytic subunit [Xanthomonadales bacterium]
MKPASVVRQHLLDIAQLSDSRIQHIFQRARQYHQQAHEQHASQWSQPLAGYTVALLFYEASTRTRVSFELAAKRLGAHTVVIQAEASSATKGETLLDTLNTLAAMDIDAVVLRHPDDSAAEVIAQQAPAGLSIINAGAGKAAHPSQALLDVFTVQQQGIDIANTKLTIVGDVRHSRVANSNVVLWQRLGAQVRLAAPEYFQSQQTTHQSLQRFDRLDEALPDTDVMMMLRIQKERLPATLNLDLSAYQQDWCLNQSRLQQLPAHSVVLHPGPMNRDVEISAEVADGPRALVLDQVRSGVFVRMGILHDCLA